jgi:hypothetical protein
MTASARVARNKSNARAAVLAPARASTDGQLRIGTNWEGTGVKPDVAVPADEALDRAHELAVQKILANAQDEETRRWIQMDFQRSREWSRHLAAKEPKPPDAQTSP